MAVATYQPGGLIAGDYPVAHRSVTIAAGENLVRGAVLGRVSSGDTYKLSASGAGDGSQTPVAVLAEDVDATGGAVTAPAYFSGEFAADKLTFGTGHTKTTVEASWRQNMHPLFVRDRA